MLPIDASPLATKLEQVDHAYAQLTHELASQNGGSSKSDEQRESPAVRLKRAEESYHLQLLSLSMLVRTQIERAQARALSPVRK